MSDVVIKGVDSLDELDTAKDLMARSHYPDYYSGLRALNECDRGYPDYKREHNRVLYANGDLAAALRVITHTIRIGEARLKMGGIACVTTAGPMRYKGYAARLMSDSMQYLYRHGYHVSTLFGIADFYHRWGFASTLPEYASLIDVREADAIPAAPFKLRAMKPGDARAIQRIHTRNDTDTACSVIRLSAHISSLWDKWQNAQILTDLKGKVVAYYMGGAHGAEYHVGEVGVLDYGWCSAVLHACMKQAGSEFASRLRFAVPPSHPFVRYLLQYRSDHEMHVARNSDGMMAVVNLEETLECMIPEWESQLVRTRPSDFAAEATLVIKRKPYRIRARHGVVDVAATAGDNKISVTAVELIQLITGARHLEEMLATKRRALNASGMALLSVLFPKRTPYVWHIDRF